MYRSNKIAVVMPAYNEELLIQKAIEAVPDYVDKIVVIDDCSSDRTEEKVWELTQSYHDKLISIRHPKNQGVGASIATGYKWCRDNQIDIAVVMAGDAQMDPADMPALLHPVALDQADFTKGNRLFSGEAYTKIPKIRYFGNAMLSLFTKIASGYWNIADSQSGYTAAGKKVLQNIDWDKMYKRYGQPNDLLVRLNVNNFRVHDVQVRPVYNIGEKSGIRIWKAIFSISWLLFRMFFWRLKEKYVIRDFHPLVFFYALSGFLLVANFALTVRLIWLWYQQGFVPPTTALALVFCGVSCLQTMFFAMWFDMQSNRDLN